MGHVQTTIRKLRTWAYVHDLVFRHYKPDLNVLLTLTVDSPFCSNIRHSNEGQLTAVKSEHPLTMITCLYHGLIFLPIEVTYFFKFSSSIIFDHGLYPSQKIWQSRDRTPNVRPFAPQAYQFLISHFLASLGACSLILYIHVTIMHCIQKDLGFDDLTGPVKKMAIPHTTRKTI